MIMWWARFIWVAHPPLSDPLFPDSPSLLVHYYSIPPRWLIKMVTFFFLGGEEPVRKPLHRITCLSSSICSIYFPKNQQAHPLTVTGRRLLSPFSILSHQPSLMLVCRQVPVSLLSSLFAFSFPLCSLSAYRLHHSLLSSGLEITTRLIRFCIA